MSHTIDRPWGTFIAADGETEVYYEHDNDCSCTTCEERRWQELEQEYFPGYGTEETKEITTTYTTIAKKDMEFEAPYSIAYENDFKGGMDNWVYICMKGEDVMIKKFHMVLDSSELAVYYRRIDAVKFMLKQGVKPASDIVEAFEVIEEAPIDEMEQTARGIEALVIWMNGLSSVMPTRRTGMTAWVEVPAFEGEISGELNCQGAADIEYTDTDGFVGTARNIKFF